MIHYGLISETDARTLEKTIDLICEEVKDDEIICVTEVGVYGGDTGMGITNYIASKNRNSYLIGIENYKDNEKVRVIYDEMIIGNSNEVYFLIPDNSQHLIFVDALHTKIAVIGDFFAYAPKVKVGGYLAFHDTGKHLDPLSGWQGVGDKNNPDFCLGGVRRALEEIGLIWKENKDFFIDRYADEWELIFDEADPEDSGGGIAVFKRIF